MNNSVTRMKATCQEAINSIILLMRKHGIPIPSKFQKSRVHEDLPATPESREVELIRRFRYLEPESRERIAERLNDLLAYAEVAKVLRSELIAIIVLSKLRKWENLLLNPELEIPPIPPPSPETKRKLLERRHNIEERDRRTAEVLRQYEEHGENRRAAIQSVNPFEENVRTFTLPPQTIASPSSQSQGDSAARVNLEEQRRKHIEEYKQFGALKKSLHSYPEHERNIKGPKLPEHGLPLTASDLVDTQYVYKELERQKRVNLLKRQLQDFMINRNVTTQTENEQIPTPPAERKTRELERKQKIEERDQRVENVIREYEEQGEIRRAAVQSRDPFEKNVRKFTLPPQTIAPPHSRMPTATPARVDIEEQRRRDIEQYEKFGAIRKRLHDLPDFNRDLQGPKLPAHDIPLKASQHVDLVATPSRFRDLGKRRELDHLQQKLREVIVMPRRDLSKDRDCDLNSPPSTTTTATRSQRPKENIEERDRRVANILRQYEELGERRRAAKQSVNSSENIVRTTTLPPQTIAPPLHSGLTTSKPVRVDIEEQRRRDIEQYKRFGAIRKRLHDLPDFDRDLQGPKLPAHGIPLKTSHVATQYKNLENQRRMDVLRRQMREVFRPQGTRRFFDPETNPNDRPDSDHSPKGPVDPDNEQ